MTTTTNELTSTLAKNSITINAELQKSHEHSGIARKVGLQNGR